MLHASRHLIKATTRIHPLQRRNFSSFDAANVIIPIVYSLIETSSSTFMGACTGLQASIIWRARNRDNNKEESYFKKESRETALILTGAAIGFSFGVKCAIDRFKYAISKYQTKEDESDKEIS